MGDGLKRAFTAARLTRSPPATRAADELRLGRICPTCLSTPKIWCRTKTGEFTKNLHATRK